jgi:two-component system phosphate regulon sensor histidine kinase PhoR
MSHELKTPIATVKVALEALNNYNFIEDKKRSREYLGMATTEMDRLELLATRVLNTSLLESGKISLQRESYDLKKLVEEVLLAMQPRIDKQQATVSFHPTGNGFVIPIDRLHMQGVLVNLIDNSLKYGVAPVHIDIKLNEHNGAVQLALSDNGPGIPEEYREKVFEKFFRVPSGNRHDTKGYGLGLSYAAQVMRQHNGSINVNNALQGGCVFTLSF